MEYSHIIFDRFSSSRLSPRPPIHRLNYFRFCEAIQIKVGVLFHCAHSKFTLKNSFIFTTYTVGKKLQYFELPTNICGWGELNNFCVDSVYTKEYVSL